MFESSSGVAREDTIRVEKYPTHVVKHLRIHTPDGAEHETVLAYTLDGAVIGDPALAYNLVVKLGITPQVAPVDAKVRAIAEAQQERTAKDSDYSEDELRIMAEDDEGNVDEALLAELRQAPPFAAEGASRTATYGKDAEGRWFGWREGLVVCFDPKITGSALLAEHAAMLFSVGFSWAAWRGIA